MSKTKQKPDITQRALGLAVKRLREKAGMSQVDCAERLGLTAVSECNREAGKQNFSATEIARYENLFGCKPGDVSIEAARQLRLLQRGKVE